MTTLEIVFIVAMVIAAVIGFLQTHWFIAILMAGLLGVVLWLLYALLSNVDILLVPLLFWR